MKAHPELRDIICSGHLTLSDLSDEEHYMMRCIIAILRLHNPQYGSLKITFMAAKAVKYDWADTLTVK